MTGDIKVTKVATWKAPDGTYHETIDGCKNAVRKAVILKQMDASFDTGTARNPTIDEIATIVHDTWDQINRKVDEIMSAV